MSEAVRDSGIRVTVLGSSNAIPRPGRACSGYLVEGGGAAVVTDLGTGAFGNLLRVRAAEDVDAVVISHMHADHFIDVIPMRYALKYGPRNHDRRIALWLPPGGAEMLRRLVDAFAIESEHDFLEEVFTVDEYDPGSGIMVGAMRVRFAPTEHYITTFAMRFEVDSASMTYTADTAPSESVARLARETGLLFSEATLSPNETEISPRGHMSAEEAGRLAAAADVRCLALTHYPTGASPEGLLDQAREAYAGDSRVVDDLDQVQTTDSH